MGFVEMALLVSVFWWQGCGGEVFTALVEMEDLLDTEAVLIDTLSG